jgi:hypothetical protein
VREVITKYELEKIYRDNQNEVACQILGVSMPTMLKYLKENGIELKGSGGHNNKIQIID